MSKKTKSANNAALPAGYQVISTIKSEKWNYEKDPMIEGVVVRAAEIKKGGRVRNDTRVVDLQLDDGRVVSIWQSAAIKDAFDAIFKIGEGKCRAAFLYRGTRQVPGRRMPMHDIIAGVKRLK